ncbi:putative alpha-1 collagen isoform X4 [Apostichopus japonicus]|uniref:Putative alpha-1 collagen isoform X4 n=1 Tax=Stichopus japonicus TaxID=307972 RepID=A0A2G8KC19_STIJA|nr:putative alpha-1 collagen isoform X4 [Apostichopus japonicus]
MVGSLSQALPQTVDLTDGIGCGKYKYICAEIRKHEPEPNFSYTLKKKNSPKGCAKVTCIDRKKETPTVEFKSVQPTPVTLIIGESNDVTTDVTVEFEPETTDPSVSGKGLWDMSVWFSKSDTGAGSSTVPSIVLRNLGNIFETFSGVTFDLPELPMTVDLTNAIGCGKYRFICARIRKGDPVPDYTLVGPKSVVGCAPVTCEKPPEEEEDPLIIVSTTITPVTIYIGEAHNVFPDIDVQFEGEEGVTGTDLWEMSIWFNKNADGSGKKTDLAENTLTREQRNQPLVITESLVFEEIEKSVDLTQVEGCGKFKYICCEIRQSNPSPPFEYKKKKPSSVRSCAKTSCEVREEPEPTVQFESTQPTGVTIYEEELNVVNTDVVVNFNEPNTDPTVAGVDLWQMQLWFSKAENGLGSSIGTIESALSEEQADQPVSFTDFSFEGLEARADLTAQGCGKFQYLCARVRRDKPDPSYKLIGKDPSQTTGCAPVICERGRDPTVEFASVEVTPVTVFEETNTPVTTTVTVTFNEERTDEVSGSGLWQVDLWFSKGSDGTGSSSDGVSDVLTAAQASQPVNFRRFKFTDLEIAADLTPVSQGCGKYRFICAQIRRDEPDPTHYSQDVRYVGCAPLSK